MTHDELLAELTDTDPVYTRATLYSALRAVVELHRPAWYNSRDTEIKDAYCAGCDERCGCWEGDIMTRNTWESCPTIKAIEKELA
jgi:hypothetical protein